MKICKDCKHEYTRHPHDPFQYCINEKCIDDSLGAVLGRLPCIQARAKDGKCGVEGKYFEDISKPISFWSKIKELLK